MRLLNTSNNKSISFTTNLFVALLARVYDRIDRCQNCDNKTDDIQYKVTKREFYEKNNNNVNCRNFIVRILSSRYTMASATLHIVNIFLFVIK